MTTALITGASKGIGKALAILMAQRGHNLVLVARSEPALSQLQSEIMATCETKVWCINVDLSTQGAAESIFARLSELHIVPDILVNNAGVGDVALFSDADLDKQKRMIGVNINSVTELTYLFLQNSRLAKQYWVLNIASTAAFLPGPSMSVYYASKAYVLHFTEALAEEFNNSNVFVSAFCPGPVATDFQASANMPEAKGLKKHLLLSAEEAAKRAYKAIFDANVVTIPSFKNRVAVFLASILPRRVAMRAVLKSNELGHKNEKGLYKDEPKS